MTDRGKRRTEERGSALLIVFVFAAIIAIFLYRELPVSVFEAKRQKEQLLVDRGHEYVRAIQLFYRRNHGQFPASIEQMEKTNNIRYLRRRYKDPFTGKDDWRLLHAGPGGLLIDSKVNPQPLNGNPGQTAAQGPFGSSAATSSPQSVSSTDSASGDGVVVAPVVQRGPAVAANGEGSASGQPPTTAQLDQNPDQPIVPRSAAVAATTNGAPATGQGAARATGPVSFSFGQPAVGAQTPGAPNAQAPGVMQTMAPILGSPTNQGAQANGVAAGTTFNSGNSLGRLNGGGALAGVASIAKGHSIKLVDEQSDYSLWEFHYDPSKDTSLSGGAGPAGNLQNGQVAPTGAVGNQNTNQQGVFGQSNQPGANQPATDGNQQDSNPDQTNPNQVNPNQSDPNQPNPNQFRPNQAVPMQAAPAQPQPEPQPQ